MELNKLKVSLIITGVLSLGLFGLASFIVDNPLSLKESSPVEQNLSGESQGLAFISIDFGGGRRKVMEIKPNGIESLFQITKERLAEDGIELYYAAYSGLGELITRIGDEKNGTEGKYWQFWVNGTYSQVGASSYIPKAGDIIEWKFTPSQQLR